MIYIKQLQGIVNQYRKSGQPWPAEKRATSIIEDVEIIRSIPPSFFK